MELVIADKLYFPLSFPQRCEKKATHKTRLITTKESTIKQKGQNQLSDTTFIIIFLVQGRELPTEYTIDWAVGKPSFSHCYIDLFQMGENTKCSSLNSSAFTCKLKSQRMIQPLKSQPDSDRSVKDLAITVISPFHHLRQSYTQYPDSFGRAKCLCRHF